jgi:hypothetical protein
MKLIGLDEVSSAVAEALRRDRPSVPASVAPRA